MQRKQGDVSVGLSLCFSRCARNRSSLDAQYPFPLVCAGSDHKANVVPDTIPRNVSEPFTWANLGNLRHSPRVGDPVMILILHGRLSHTARMWWARWNLELWQQNLGLKPLHPITLFQKWMRLIVPLKENTISWKEGGDCSCTVWGDDAYGSVESDIRSQFWVEVSALQGGMKTQQIAEYLLGSGNWIESQIFYLSVLFNSCIVSLQHLYL